MQKNLKSLILIILPILIAIIFSYTTQAFIVSNEEMITSWLAQFGVYVILVYLILQAVTLIIAPIGGFFMVIAMIALFGVEKALILVYIASTPVYLINFYLARKYGRPLVTKIVGKSALEKVDKLISESGLAVLIITRVFQGGNFDYISYGWGLTKIPLKTFAIVNFIGAIPYHILLYIIFTRTNNLTYGVGILFITSATLTASAVFLIHYFKHHKLF